MLQHVFECCFAGTCRKFQNNFLTWQYSVFSQEEYLDKLLVEFFESFVEKYLKEVLHRKKKPVNSSHEFGNKQKYIVN